MILYDICIMYHIFECSMAIITIPIKHECARLLHDIDVPGIKTDTSQLHITLLDLGEEISIETLAKAMVVVHEIVEQSEPFQVRINNVSCFPALVEGASVPIIAPIQCQAINDLNKGLKRLFNKAKIGYDKRFPKFHPHITLSRYEEAIKRTKIEPIEWNVQELVLWGGSEGDNRIFITFPLTIKKNCEIECEKIEE